MHRPFTFSMQLDHIIIYNSYSIHYGSLYKLRQMDWWCSISTSASDPHWKWLKGLNCETFKSEWVVEPWDPSGKNDDTSSSSRNIIWSMEEMFFSYANTSTMTNKSRQISLWCSIIMPTNYKKVTIAKAISNVDIYLGLRL